MVKTQLIFALVCPVTGRAVASVVDFGRMICCEFLATKPLLIDLPIVSLSVAADHSGSGVAKQCEVEKVPHIQDIDVDM
ncbi:hypothetical protein [Saccharospirillum alexandrii]|uniref:hypothetical protein n=1 Tax=Saccharospirillum alexandrii TaxID=2448477 RepID=UPI0037360CCD